MLQNATVFNGFSVNNIDKAYDFYKNTLGVKTQKNQMGMIELYDGEKRMAILYPKPDHKPAEFTVLNFVVKDLETTVDALIAKGVTFQQYDEPIKTNEKGICRNDMGPAIAWFTDPSGNIIAVMEY